jgi:hypothetical protein
MTTNTGNATTWFEQPEFRDAVTDAMALLRTSDTVSPEFIETLGFSYGDLVRYVDAILCSLRDAGAEHPYIEPQACLCAFVSGMVFAGKFGVPQLPTLDA